MEYLTCLLFSLLNNLMLLADNNEKLMEDVTVLIVKFTNIGGGLWLAWGVVVLAGGLKDKNGPALQSGIWQMAGGGLIIVAANVFKTVVS